MSTSMSELVVGLAGVAFEPGQSGYEDEVAGFNAAIAHRPEVVVGPRTIDDVVRAVRFARARGLRVAVQSTGHGAHASVQGGVLVATRRLDRVQLDAAARQVIAGAGVRWGAVIASAAPHELAPIAGSSPTVGVVGFLSGGGIGPLVRSHGFGADYLLGATLVTGTGDVVKTSAEENPEIIWALRGGRPRLGVVTEVTLRLAHLPALYAGSLFFDEPHIEVALRGWIAWTERADPRVSTSVAIARMPPVDAVPPPLRGRRVLTLRFAYPGGAEDGARLASPLRALAPVLLDGLDSLPLAEVPRIYNDPAGPVPAWASGGLLASVDQDLATALLRHVGAGTDGPFMAAEIRQLGEAAARDVPGGSAVGGRGAGFTFGLIGTNPAHFATVLPDAEARLVGDLSRWLSPEANGNYAPHPDVRGPARPEPPSAIRDRLSELARRYDPDGLFR